MEKQTEQNINEAIDWLQSTGGAIQDFATEQAPLYCREVVAWELWSGVAGASLGLVLLVTGLLVLKRGFKEFQEEPCSDISGCLFSIGIVVSIAGFLLAVLHVPDAIKASVAPRIVIIEHLRGLKQ